MICSPTWKQKVLYVEVLLLPMYFLWKRYNVYVLHIWSNIHNIHNGKETVSISVQSHSYINDVLSINKQEFENYPDQMCPAELEIKDTTESITFASYLYLLLSIGRDSQMHTSIYDKRDDFIFFITNFPFLISIIPSLSANGVFFSLLIRYARACSVYECFIQRARRLPSKLLKQCYLVKHLKSSFRKFNGRYIGVFQQYEVSLRRIWNDILTHLTSYSDFPTDQTFHQYHDLDTKLDLHRITSGFHGAFAMGVACQQGTLTLSPGSVLLLGTFLCSNFWDQFYRTRRIFCRLFTLNTPWYFLDLAQY